MEYAYEGNAPKIEDSAFVCEEATLIGDVTVGQDASIWPGAVLRGDFGPVRVGDGSHVEENAVLHHATVGEDVLVGHGAVINEATTRDRVIVGINATLNKGVSVGSRSVIAPNAVVPEGREVHDESIARGVPADIVPIAETGTDPETIFGAYEAEGYTAAARKHEDLFGHQ